VSAKRAREIVIATLEASEFTADKLGQRRRWAGTGVFRRIRSSSQADAYLVDASFNTSPRNCRRRPRPMGNGS
jgi:hypothetical protein